jgi:hypothetical protein
MTRETWIADLRKAEEILQYCGEAMRNDDGETRRWKFMYWLAVAVYHLLMDKVRNGK